MHRRFPFPYTPKNPFNIGNGPRNKNIFPILNFGQGSLVGAGNLSLTNTRNTTATVVDFEGIVRTAAINEARFQGMRRVQNLILGRSQDFGNATFWQLISVAIISGEADPYGGNTAFHVTSTGSNGTISFATNPYTVVAGRQYRITWYVKQGNGGPVTTTLSATTAGFNANVTFTSTPNWQRISSNVVTASVGGGFSAFTAVGGAVPFFSTGMTLRISGCMIEDVTGQSNQNPSEYVSVGVLTSPWNGAGVDGVKYFPIQNGNTVVGNIVTVGTGAPLPNGTTYLQGLLAEPNAATNGILWSQDFSNAAWTKTNGTVGTNSIAPDGTSTMQSISATATSPSGVLIYQSPLTITTAQQRQISIFAKYDGNNPLCSLSGWDTTSFANGVQVWFNLQTGTVGSTSLVGTGWTLVGTPTVEPYGNGSLRISIIINTAGTNIVTAFNPATDVDNSPACTIGKSNSFWGFQNEASLGSGSRPSSYIPTTTIVLTRSADFFQTVAVPITGTYVNSRSTIADLVDWEGAVRTAKVGEVRNQGRRRVQNTYTGSSEDFTNVIWAVTGTASKVGTTNIVGPFGPNVNAMEVAFGATVSSLFYQPQPNLGITGTRVVSWYIRAKTSATTVRLVASNVPVVINVTTAWQRFSISETSSGGTTSGLQNNAAGTTGNLYIYAAMAEDVTGQSNQNPSEYVSVGVLSSPYQGYGVDGVNYFSTQNGNTVTNNIVTAGAGAIIAPSQAVRVDLPISGGNNYLTSPNALANQISGSLDFDVLVQASNWSTVPTQLLFSKDDGSSNRSFNLYCASGLVTFQVSSDGSTMKGTSGSLPVTITNNSPIYLRATYSAGTGTSVLYWSPVGNGTNWTQISTTTNTPGNIYIGGNVALTFGASAGSSSTLGGAVYSARVYNGLRTTGGTLAVNFDASRFVNGNVAAQMSTGEVWTCQGNAKPLYGPGFSPRVVKNYLTCSTVRSSGTQGWTPNGGGSYAITTGVADPFGGTSAVSIIPTGASGLRQAGATAYPINSTIVGSVWMRVPSGTQSVNFTVDISAAAGLFSCPVTTTWTRFSTVPVAGVSLGAGAIINIANGSPVEIYLCQAEVITGQISSAPSEPVSVGVLSAPYQFAGADGVQNFATKNGNTVTNNVVTANTGTVIQDGKATWVNLSGATGDYVSTPHSPSQTITGKLEFQIVQNLSSLAVNTWRPFNKWDGTGAAKSFLGLWSINGSSASSLAFFWIDSSATQQSVTVTNIPLTAGIDMTFMGRFDPTTGQFNLYNSIDGGITWTLTGTQPAAFGVTSLNPSPTCQMQVGTSDAAGAGAHCSASVRSAKLYRGFSNAGGNLIVNFDATKFTGGTTAVMSTGETWTLQGNARVNYALAQGQLNEPFAATNAHIWSQRFEINGFLTATPLSGTFVSGETVISTGGGTGVIAFLQSASVFWLSNMTGTFSGTITGGTSLATGTFSTSGTTGWINTRTTIGTSSLAPDGTTSMQSLSCNSTDANGSILSETITISSGQQRLGSVYVKYDGNNPWCRLTVWDSSANGTQMWFNLQTGTVGTISNTGTGWAAMGQGSEYEGNGVYRIWLIANTTGTTCATGIQIVADADNTSASTTGKSNSFWGAMNEVSSGPYSRPSTYIPTTIVAATRNADVITTPTTYIAGGANGSNSIDMMPVTAISTTTDARVFAYSGGVSGLYANNATNLNTYDGTNVDTHLSGVTWPVNTRTKLSGAWDSSLSLLQASKDGIIGATKPFDGNMESTGVVTILNQSNGTTPGPNSLIYSMSFNDIVKGTGTWASFFTVNPAINFNSFNRPQGMTFVKAPVGSAVTQLQTHGQIVSSSDPVLFSSSQGVFKGSVSSPIQIIAHGDSITYGFGCSEPYLPRLVRKVAVAKSIAIDYKNAGTSGIGYDYTYTVGFSMNSEAATKVDAAKSLTATNYLIVFGGTNDVFLNSYTPAQLRTAFQTYISARIATGWIPANICVCTMLPRQNYSEPNRTTINANFVTDAGTYGYRIARLDLDANIGVAGQQNNTTYFSDQIHPTDAGQIIITNLIQAALLP